MRSVRGSHHRGYRNLSFIYYRCPSLKREEVCHSKHVEQNFFKIVVMDQIKNLLKTACEKDALIRKIEKESLEKSVIAFRKRQVSRAEDKIRQIEERLVQAYMDFAEGLLNEEEYDAVKQGLNEKKEQCEKKFTEEGEKVKELERAIARYHSMVEKYQNYDQMSFSEELVKALVDQI